MFQMIVICSVTATEERTLLQADARYRVWRLGKDPGRNDTPRQLRFAAECEGIECVFLTHFSRWKLPLLMSVLRLSGPSAEIGLAGAGFALSGFLMRDWRAGGQQLVVELNSSGEACGGNCLTQNGSASWLMARFGDRVHFARSPSAVAAAGMVPFRSLDFVYIDTDRNAEGMYADLRTWWWALQPGGVFVGHDWLNSAVAHGLRAFVIARGGRVQREPRVLGMGMGRRRVFITAERPASWILFRPLDKPCPSTHRQQYNLRGQS